MGLTAVNERVGKKIDKKMTSTTLLDTERLRKQMQNSMSSKITALETFLRDWERNKGTILELMLSDDVKALLKFPEKRNILLDLNVTSKVMREEMDNIIQNTLSVSGEEYCRS